MSKMKSDQEKQKKSAKKKIVSPPAKLDLKNNKDELERLQNTRVVIRELVYIIGLSPRLANKTV